MKVQTLSVPPMLVPPGAIAGFHLRREEAAVRVLRFSFTADPRAAPAPEGVSILVDGVSPDCGDGPIELRAGQELTIRYRNVSEVDILLGGLFEFVDLPPSLCGKTEREP